jgi:hypothetical protein
LPSLASDACSLSATERSGRGRLQRRREAEQESDREREEEGHDQHARVERKVEHDRHLDGRTVAGQRLRRRDRDEAATDATHREKDDASVSRRRNQPSPLAPIARRTGDFAGARGRAGKQHVGDIGARNEQDAAPPRRSSTPMNPLTGPTANAGTAAQGKRAMARSQS